MNTSMPPFSGSTRNTFNSLDHTNLLGMSQTRWSNYDRGHAHQVIRSKGQWKITYSQILYTIIVAILVLSPSVPRLLADIFKHIDDCV